MEELLSGLRAAAEGTRLRILGLCAHGELTVSDLVAILGQSQPRISRHLRLLVEAGLLLRHQEGNWAFYRLNEDSGNGAIARLIVDLMPADDTLHARDLEGLQEVQEAWAVSAGAYFKKNAANWSGLKSLEVDEAQLDKALARLLSGVPVGELLDIGTGTGHVLEVLGKSTESGIGIDRSLDMLKFARANIWRAGLRNCQVRHADMMQLPFPQDRFDTITFHMVLHYAERPERAVTEAARVLKPGGRLVVADFAPHDRSELREAHAHRWLGFKDEKIKTFFEKAGLMAEKPVRLEGAPLTVCLWMGRKAANDSQDREHEEKVS